MGLNQSENLKEKGQSLWIKGSDVESSGIYDLFFSRGRERVIIEYSGRCGVVIVQRQKKTEKFQRVEVGK